MIDDGTCRIVQQAFTITIDLLVGICSPVKRLDICRIQVDCGRRVFDDFFPVAQRMPTCSTIRVEDRVLSAEDRFTVEIDRFVVFFGAIGFVAGSLQLCCVFLALLLTSV